MAFTVADFEDLLRLLSDHPEWRAQLRPVVLGEEFLQIPSRLDRVDDRLGTVEDQLRLINARMDALDQRMGALEKGMAAFRERMDACELRMGAVELRMEAFEQRMDVFEQRMDAFELRMEAFEKRMELFDKRLDRMDGRMGNIEGQLLEIRYERQLGSWFSRWLKKPERVSTSDLDLYEAQAEGRISADELEGLTNLDLLVRGNERGADAATTLHFAVEVSYTVNLEDVTRAFDRAGALQKAGLRARALVGGYRATEEAERLAEKLDVILDLHHPAA